MPSGSYYAIALDYVEAGAWSDPELLERLKTRAKRFTLGDGQIATTDLKLAEIDSVERGVHTSDLARSFRQQLLRFV